jgi:hypothetical protein
MDKRPLWLDPQMEDIQLELSGAISEDIPSPYLNHSPSGKQAIHKSTLMNRMWVSHHPTIYVSIHYLQTLSKEPSDAKAT